MCICLTNNFDCVKITTESEEDMLLENVKERIGAFKEDLHFLKECL